MSKTTIRIVIARTDGQVVGQYLLGEGEHLIGREESCPIFLDDTHVSREHARLIITSDMIEVEDLNSTSGTYLDGVMLRGRVPIQLGQKLHISDLYIDIEHLGFDRLVKGARLGDGRFTLIRELGKGGMGVVWLALDEEEEEELALKLIPTELSSDRDNL